MTEESQYLLAMAQRLGSAIAALPTTKAVMVTGSVALGESDRYSDIDMTAYYDELPSEAELDAIRTAHGGSERLWVLGNRDEGGFAESYSIHDVHCQIGHVTLAVWEAQMALVLEQHDPTTPLHKAMSGTLDCIPLYGEELITEWKARIAQYPDALARSVVEKHLSFFPLWYLEDYLQPRDAVLWTYQSFVETAQNIVGVLAGLNKLYYSTFQFKRMRAFIAKMQRKPAMLAERIEQLFTADTITAAKIAEGLVRDVVQLVEEYMPDVDTAKAKHRIGKKHEQWEPYSEQQ